MGDVINLNARRKAAERERSRKLADENSARFGRSKALKKLEETRAEKARAGLDAHRRSDAATKAAED